MTSVDASCKVEPKERFQHAMDMMDAETVAEGGIQGSFYMKPFDEDPEELALWPALPTKDDIGGKTPFIFKNAHIFSYSKKRSTRSLILLTSPLTESNLFGRSLASIALDPHDIHRGENVDFKRRDEDGVPIVTLRDIHSEADRESVEFHSKGIWSDPNKPPGELDVWPPPHLALALAKIYAPSSTDNSSQGLSFGEEIRAIPTQDSRLSPPLSPLPPNEDGISCIPDSSFLDSCPGTPSLVPDASPVPVRSTTPPTVSFLDSFQSLQLADSSNTNIDSVIPQASDEPRIEVTHPSSRVMLIPSSTSPHTDTLLSPSSSTTVVGDTSPREPASQALQPDQILSQKPRNRSKFSSPPKKRQFSRPKPGTRFKAVVFPLAKRSTPVPTYPDISLSNTPNFQAPHSPTSLSSASSGSPSHEASSPPATSSSGKNASDGVTILVANESLPVVRNGARLECPLCIDSFKHLGDLTRHVSQKHDPTYPGLKCPLCYKPLSRSDAVKRHLDRQACGKRIALKGTVMLNQMLGRT